MRNNEFLLLPGWTLRGAIQNKVHAYVSRSTLQEISRSFPYLVSKQYASGGGDVCLTTLFDKLGDLYM
jgi:hypothetical protein